MSDADFRELVKAMRVAQARTSSARSSYGKYDRHTIEYREMSQRLAREVDAELRLLPVEKARW